MAYLTDEQAKVLDSLNQEYGVPDLIKIEFTSDPYGIVWCWWAINSRNLFIRPDGTRLSWRPLLEGDGVG